MSSTTAGAGSAPAPVGPDESLAQGAVSPKDGSPAAGRRAPTGAFRQRRLTHEDYVVPPDLGRASADEYEARVAELRAGIEDERTARGALEERVDALESVWAPLPPPYPSLATSAQPCSSPRADPTPELGRPPPPASRVSPARGSPMQGRRLRISPKSSPLGERQPPVGSSPGGLRHDRMVFVTPGDEEPTAERKPMEPSIREETYDSSGSVSGLCVNCLCPQQSA